MPLTFQHSYDQTSVNNKIPVDFRDKEPPIVSYEYTSTVASKLFNFAPPFQI